MVATRLVALCQTLGIAHGAGRSAACVRAARPSAIDALRWVDSEINVLIDRQRSFPLWSGLPTHLAAWPWWPLTIPLVLWLALYPPRLMVGHTRLATNAYDLSVFDYALWSTIYGRLGDVPFIGHSLFAHHFMPTLLVVLPFYAVWATPGFLIIAQSVFMAGAAILLHRLTRTRVSALMACAICTAFLFGRRSHSAVTSVFYIDSLEPLLIFALLLSWLARRWVGYGVVLLLALGCKEDMALYLACFGAVLMLSGERRVGLITMSAAILWGVVAVGWAIPSARIADGLSPSNPFLEGRFDSRGSSPTDIWAQQIFSSRTLSRCFALLASTAFLALGAPIWLLTVGPGVALNLAARPDSVQAGLTGHYLWPVLPWLFWCTVMGAARLEGRSVRAGTMAAVLILGLTIADSPLWRALARGYSVSSAEARAIRGQLAALPSDVPIISTPQLVPHIPKRHRVATLGVNQPAVAEGLVIIGSDGDLWPLDLARIKRLTECLSGSPDFTNRSAGRLAIYETRGLQPVAWPSCLTPAAQRE